MESRSEVNRRCHIVTQTEIDTGQGVVTNRLNEKRKRHKHMYNVYAATLYMYMTHVHVAYMYTIFI